MTDERKRALLERAIADKELLANVPPIVAFAFGVLPLKLEGAVLTLASIQGASAEAMRALRAVLDREIVAAAFDERLVQTMIQKAYPDEKDHAINFPTFSDPDFLSHPETAKILREPKVERIGATGSDLEAGTVVLAAFTYRGRLHNLEFPRLRGNLPDARRIKYELRDEDLVWTYEGGEPIVWPDAAKAEPLPAILLDEYRFSDNLNFSPGSLYAEHKASGVALTGKSLPFIIHPTEVQLLRVERSGALIFHVYDREERVEAGTSREFSCRYYFLSFGQRLRREIDITVHDVLRADRTKLLARPGKPRWGAREVERWFALEGECGAPRRS
jgi:hypothetical protein